VTDDHQPVMVEEVLAFLAPRPEAVYLDATVGLGGHAGAILRNVGGRCTLIGVDRDPKALARATYNLREFAGSVHLARANFSDLEWVLSSHDVERVDGILLDLGMSSMQLDDRSRGFAFRSEGPLDMRMDPEQPLSAAEVVNTYKESDLTRIIREFGEERYAGRIARAIVRARRTRPVRSTGELAEIIEDAYPAGPRRQHPARRTFQALRIEVNAELDALRKVLDEAPELLSPGGRIVVISYHSLEDRLVKSAFEEPGGAASLPGLGRVGAHGPLQSLTRGAVLPSGAEVERNPRASSARLRAAARRGNV
jgi:16S rRNA (cytosine1402-N4)-methyltransferase